MWQLPRLHSPERRPRSAMHARAPTVSCRVSGARRDSRFCPSGRYDEAQTIAPGVGCATRVEATAERRARDARPTPPCDLRTRARPGDHPALALDRPRVRNRLKHGRGRRRHFPFREGVHTDVPRSASGGCDRGLSLHSFSFSSVRLQLRTRPTQSWRKADLPVPAPQIRTSAEEKNYSYLFPRSCRVLVGL
jgi:hypothetical protein